MSDPRQLVPGPEHEGERLDLFVGQALGLSRAKLKELFEAGAVRVGSRPARKGDRVRPGMRVAVLVPEEQPALAPAQGAEQPLRILYEDAWLVAVDKAAGTPSHPLRPGELGTVANALVQLHPECAGASEDPREGGLCHRLDIETSGVLLAARDRSTWEALRGRFSRREVDKRYLALVTGPIADEGEIDLPLRHHGRRADRVEAAAEGGPEAREAVSRFRVIARSGEYSLVEVQILTGVLHQVRAHLASIGAPLVGDSIYGGRPDPQLGRFFLHARRLAFEHPREPKRVSIESPLPRELGSALERLGVPATGLSES